MARIASLDFGMKRCGLAISDPSATIANGLDTVETHQIINALIQLKNTIGFSTLVVGKPLTLLGKPATIEPAIADLIEKLSLHLPGTQIVRVDERFTSTMAAQTLKLAGANQRQRRLKTNLDKVSATILLQDYLNSISG